MTANTAETDVKSYRITVVNRNQEFLCRQDKTLLAGMEQKGVRCIEVGCRGGGCGMCKIRILDGKFESKRMSRQHVSAEEEKQGFALSCRIVPCSDMVIESDHFTPAQ